MFVTVGATLSRRESRGPIATARLEAEFATELADPDVAGPFWLALADRQWKARQLETRVLDRARAVLSGSAELNRWTGRDRVRRQKVLDRLRDQLSKPQRAARQIKASQVQLDHTDLVPGEVLRWKLPRRQRSFVWVGCEANSRDATGRQ